MYIPRLRSQQFWAVCRFFRVPQMSCPLCPHETATTSLHRSWERVRTIDPHRTLLEGGHSRAVGPASGGRERHGESGGSYPGHLGAFVRLFGGGGLSYFLPTPAYHIPQPIQSSPRCTETTSGSPAPRGGTDYKCPVKGGRRVLVVGALLQIRTRGLRGYRSRKPHRAAQFPLPGRR